MHTFTESVKEIDGTLEISFITPYETNTWNLRKIRHCFLYSCSNIANFFVLIGTTRRIKFVILFFFFFCYTGFFLNSTYSGNEKTGKKQVKIATKRPCWIKSKEKNNSLKSVEGHFTLREACHLVPKENQV